MYLEQKGYCYSLPTLHKYMNSELGLKSIVRRKNPGYMHGKPHKVFENKLNRTSMQIPSIKSGVRISHTCF